MLSDCKVCHCTSPPPGLCVFPQSGSLQTIVPLPLIKPLKQGLHPGKKKTVCVCVCVHREREKEHIAVWGRREGRGKQWRSSIGTCIPPHIIECGRGEESRRRKRGASVGGRGRRWGRGMTRTLAVSQTALVSAERERERERGRERERDEGGIWNRECRWPVVLPGCSSPLTAANRHRSEKQRQGIRQVSHQLPQSEFVRPGNLSQPNMC